jgi:hypothetical protein
MLHKIQVFAMIGILLSLSGCGSKFYTVRDIEQRDFIRTNLDVIESHLSHMNKVTCNDQNFDAKKWATELDKMKEAAKTAQHQATQQGMYKASIYFKNIRQNIDKLVSGSQYSSGYIKKLHLSTIGKYAKKITKFLVKYH